MTYPDYLQVCAKCRKAVANDPAVVEDINRCPYCGLDMREATELKIKGEWIYEWR